jgi:glutathione S-transferase
VLEILRRNTDGTDTSTFLTQSMAIIEYLDEAHPDTAPVLPKDPLARARCREVRYYSHLDIILLMIAVVQIAEIVNSGIQPLQNLSILRSVQTAKIPPQNPEDPVVEVDGRGFAKHTMTVGLAALERQVSSLCPPVPGQTLFAAGTTEPSIADLYVVPQLYNARRFGIDLSAFPALVAVEARCATLPEFAEADAGAQPDAQK